MKNHSYTILAHGVKCGINYPVEPFCCNLCQKERCDIIWFDTYNRGMNICKDCVGRLVCVATQNKCESDSFKCGAICSCLDDLCSNSRSIRGEYRTGPYFYSGFIHVQIWNRDRSFASTFQDAICDSCQSVTEELVVLTDEIHDHKFETYFEDYGFDEDLDVADNYARREVTLCSKCLARIAGFVKTRFVFTIFKSSVGKPVIVKRQVVVPKKWSRQSNCMFPLSERQRAMLLILFIRRFERSRCRIGRHISDQILALAFDEN